MYTYWKSKLNTKIIVRSPKIAINENTQPKAPKPNPAPFLIRQSLIVS